MSYFYLLPFLVVVIVALELIVQQLTQHFVDQAILERVALSVFVAWALIGWWMEAQSAAMVYEEATYCQRVIADQHLALKAEVEAVLGWAPVMAP